MLSNVKIDNATIVDLTLAVVYVSKYGKHRDVYRINSFNITSDLKYLPNDVKNNLMHKDAGYTEVFSLKNEEAPEIINSLPLNTVNTSNFNRNPRKNLTIEPRLGRFYPVGLFSIDGEISTDKMSPARIVYIDDEVMSIDVNHPLAEYKIQLEIEVHNAYKSFDDHFNENNHLAKLLNGPGMQLRYENVVRTDFFSDQPFERIDNQLDGVFYSTARMVNHLDKTAQEQLASFYSDTIPKDAVILDLMSSINSHLPENISAKKITGLGMNQQELEANPVLDERVIHDLNDNTELPFEDASFDVVICTVSIEYIIKPEQVLVEVARILKKGGIFIATFSNRWFPTKAIQLWANLHEFERMGFVLELMLNNGSFENMNTFSTRGLPRPKDDRHKMPLSDPIYAVWCTKSK